MKEMKCNEQDITKFMGERLVMFQLMKYNNWDVDYVDYVGADLIAIDQENQRYAISVKTKNHETDGHSCSLFKYKDAENLRKFAAELSDKDNVMIPIIAYVILKLEGTLCTFLINLDNLEDMSKEGIIIKKSEKGNRYLFVYGHQGNPKDLRTEKGIKNYKKRDAELFERVIKEHRISHIITSLYSKNLNNLNRCWKPDKYFLSEEMYKSQQGDFGENYIVWRAKDYGMRAFLIKTEGVDIVLQDINNKSVKYAVSVKTFTKKIIDGYEFERRNVEHLKNYSLKWKLNPIVSLIFIINDETTDNKTTDNKTIYNMNMKLSYIEKSARDDHIKWIKCCTGKKNIGGYRFKWNKETLIELQKNNNIIFTKMIIA